MKIQLLFVLGVAAGASVALPRVSQKEDGSKEVKCTMFLPPPLHDDWTQWILGEWEGDADSDSGKGRVRARFEMALCGQFLICRGDAEITELDPEYLKKHMHASDEEIDRFRRSGYQSLEVYTVDQKTGEVIGFLFDNLRCTAQGRGKRDGNQEIIEWEWGTGHKSARITKRVSEDKILGVERTRNADGSIMEDRGEMTRVKRPSGSEKSRQGPQTESRPGVNILRPTPVAKGQPWPFAIFQAGGWCRSIRWCPCGMSRRSRV